LLMAVDRLWNATQAHTTYKNHTHNQASLSNVKQKKRRDTIIAIVLADIKSVY